VIDLVRYKTAFAFPETNAICWAEHQPYQEERLEVCARFQNGNNAGYGTREVQPGLSLDADMLAA